MYHVSMWLCDVGDASTAALLAEYPVIELFIVCQTGHQSPRGSYVRAEYRWEKSEARTLIVLYTCH